jgi:hypothetical protein
MRDNRHRPGSRREGWQCREGRPQLPGDTPRAPGSPPLATARSRGPASRWRETPKSHGRGYPPSFGGSTVGGGEVARAGLALAGNSQVPRPGSTPRASGGPPLAAAMGARAGLALAEPHPRPGSTPDFGGPPVSGGDVVGAGLDRGCWDPLHGRECPEEPPRYWGYALNSVGRPLQKPPTATARSKIENDQVPLESPEPDLRCMGARRFV